MAPEQKYDTQTLIKSLEKLNKEYLALLPGEISFDITEEEFNPMRDQLIYSVELLTNFYENTLLTNYNEENIGSSFKVYCIYIDNLTSKINTILEDSSSKSLAHLIYSIGSKYDELTNFETFIETAQSRYK